jgi:hypothetical protein
LIGPLLGGQLGGILMKTFFPDSDTFWHSFYTASLR